MIDHCSSTILAIQPHRETDMADVKLNITINKPKVSTFRISGKTLREAMKALDARDEWGLYDGTANSKSSAKVDADGNIVSVTMEMGPEIQMPVWSGYSSATKEQKASWDRMYKALLAHENKHHDIQTDCVEDLKKAIKDAKTLDAKSLKKLIEDSQKACQKEQDSYDSRSGHGAKEGVELDLDA
jgi:predicted secreted Zn-dependent protease